MQLRPAEAICARKSFGVAGAGSTFAAFHAAPTRAKRNALSMSDGWVWELAELQQADGAVGCS